jgi:FdhD protein
MRASWLERSGETRGVEVTILRGQVKDVERRMDEVAVEEPIHILVNGERYATILCTPSDRGALVIGNMISEGLILTLDEVSEIQPKEGGAYLVRLRDDVDILRRLEMSSSFKRLILSSCGTAAEWPFSKIVDRINIPRVTDPTRFSAQVIGEAARNLNILARIYRKTGGVHAAALYTSEGTLVAFAEDVGRHNAVDKVIGLVLQQGKGFTGTMVTSTGRLTGDIVLKAARMKIPLVASLGAAIDSGVEVAAKTGVTLIGFVRGDRMTIYTCPERVSW